MEGSWESVQSDPDNNYLYNDKELDSDLGLDMYHYGARMYDASIGRFTGVDPIADQFAHASTYNYAENEPVGSIDLWGLQRVPINAIKKKTQDLINYIFGSDVKAGGQTTNGGKRRQVTGKQIGEGTKNIGDKVTKIGIGVGTVAPPVGAEIAAVGGTIELAGHGMVVMSELTSEEGLTTETKTDIVIDAAFEVLPKPIETALENANLDKVTTEFVKAQVNLVTEGVKEATKKVVSDQQHNTSQSSSDSEICEESCENDQ